MLFTKWLNEVTIACFGNELPNSHARLARSRAAALRLRRRSKAELSSDNQYRPHGGSFDDHRRCGCEIRSQFQHLVDNTRWTLAERVFAVTGDDTGTAAGDGTPTVTIGSASGECDERCRGVGR